MALAATTDTWGISGPVFLVAYVVIALVVWAVGTRARRVLADPRRTRPAGDLDSRPHDVAYLNGGAELAVYSALSAMHLREAITLAGGRVTAAGRRDVLTDGLEIAIHSAAFSPVQRRRIPMLRAVAAQLETTEKRLVTDGLLLSTPQRAAIRKIGFWMLAVAGLGLVRLLAGIAEARPIGFLLIALAGVLGVAAWQLLRAPVRTRAGNLALAELRERHHELGPSLRPDWSVYGPVGAALAVGVFGTSALVASDPALASELEVQRAAAAGGGGGSYGGDSGSGGDAGGGGDGGGGGGGGCGGGGCGG